MKLHRPTALLLCLVMAAPAFSASPLKPRMVVLTDIAPNDVEPDVAGGFCLL